MVKVRLKLPGTVSQSPARVGLGRVGRLVDAEVRAHCEVNVARRSVGADEGFITDAELHDVLQFQWESGIIELVRVGDLSTKFGDAVRASNGELVVPPLRVLRDATRGESALPLDAVQHIAVKLEQSLIEKAAQGVTDLVLPSVIRKIEVERIPEPGLYALAEDGTSLGRVDSRSLGPGPLLVLVHGTFSNAREAFKDLYGTDEWRQLYRSYGAGGVLAFEHRTVTDSPGGNALQLVQELPAGARVHLVTHSRGGLIGDLLCRSRWTPQEVEQLFPGDRYAAVRQELAALAEALFSEGDGRKVTVERFLRVAAPAAGTQLAGKRLDQFFNVTLTLLGKLVDAGVGWFDFVKSLAVQALATRTRVEVCPGLEAMMPGSLFVRFLNVAEPRGDQLAVISGDVSGGKWYELLKQVFVDFYFRRRKNDFIVDTASMTRGAPRVSGLQYHYDGPSADHFSYFEDKGIRTRLLAYLTEGNRAAGFEALSRGIEGVPERGVLELVGFGAVDTKPRPHRPELPTVFILPGIMGSLLGPEAHVIWLELARMGWRGLEQLRFAADNPIVPHGLIKVFYQQLVDKVGEQFNVERHDFDWRDSIKASSEKLSRAVGAALAASSQPVLLLAHSMGGLVSRGLLAWHREIWDELTRRGGRLIMLGTPNYGSFVPAQAFSEQHPLLASLALVDLAASERELSRVIRGFPGMLEMLPRGNAGFNLPVDLLDPDSWRAIPGFSPEASALKAARAVRDELDVVPEDAKKFMVYVAGRKSRTPVKMDSLQGRVQFFDSSLGDGTVPWALGRIEGVPTYYVDAEHGDLPRHVASFPGYLDLLRNGRTTALSSAAPSGYRRDAATGEELRPSEPPLEPPYFPSERDLLAAALGSTPGEREAEGAPLDITIVNGHVYTAKYPVIVGHYEGDPITSVEALLDRWLDGQLSRDHALRIYPGPLNTMRWYRRKSEPQRGVIVVGLGQLGSLTRSRLTETLREGLLRYAADRFQLSDGSASLELPLTSVLIGSWGTLTVEDSVCAALAAVRQSNERLTREPLRPVRFDRLELIELFRDIALETAHVLQRVGDNQATASAARRNLRVDTQVQVRSSVRRARPPAHSGYYNRIAISAKLPSDAPGYVTGAGSAGTDAGPAGKTPDAFAYQVVTRLARTDSRERPVQWAHIRELLERAPKGDAGAADVLFQYMLPRELQADARDAADLVLELDDWTAQIPWELFAADDGESDGFVRRGILRTLRVDDPPRVTPSLSRRALVIGEPGDVQPELPGAFGEAVDVGKLLDTTGMRAEVLTNPSADECFRALLKEPWDVVHIAAHGYFDANNPRRSGVVLGGGRLLTASEFENMKATPSIVFLNCCHLGRIHLTAPGPWAASLAKELIALGVGVVVVAGWAVSDHAAVTFARSFYRGLFDGQPLMSVVREARRLTRAETSGVDVTWGAYQVYGAPGFTLPDWAQPARSLDNIDFSRWVSPHELVEYLLDLQVTAREEHGKRGQLNRHLDALRVATRDKGWFGQGDVSAAFGDAYASIAAYVKAIDCYRDAARSSEAQLKAVEQLANYEGRRAVQLLEQNAKDPSHVAEARQLLDSSRQRLEQLLRLGKSAERYALLGATLRRAALFESQLRESGLMEQAVEAYAGAFALKAPDAYYHAQLAQSMLLMIDPARVDLAMLEQARKLAEAAGPGNPGAVFSGLELGLLSTITTVVRGNPSAGPDPVVVTRFVTELREAWRAVAASAYERDWVRKGLKTQRELATNPSVKAWFEALCVELGA